MNLRLKTEILKRFPHQCAFAREIRMGENRLSAIVRERQQPSADERIAITQALGVEEAELFPRAEPVE